MPRANLHKRKVSAWVGSMTSTKAFKVAVCSRSRGPRFPASENTKAEESTTHRRSWVKARGRASKVESLAPPPTPEGLRTGRWLVLSDIPYLQAGREAHGKRRHAPGLSGALPGALLSLCGPAPQPCCVRDVRGDGSRGGSGSAGETAARSRSRYTRDRLAVGVSAGIGSTASGVVPRSQRQSGL